MKIKNLIFYTFIDEFENTVDQLYDENPELQDLEERQDPSLGEIVESFDKSVIDFYLVRCSKNNYRRFLNEHLKIQRNISKPNINSFRYFFAYLEAVSTIYKNIQKAVPQFDDITLTDKLIIMSYGYMCRLAYQVGAMLLNGYSDGALRVWRSLYECTVALLVISKANDEDLSNRYLDYTNRDRLRKMESFHKVHEALNFPAIDAELLAEVKHIEAQLSSTYGKEFTDKDFGWAYKFFESKKVTFRDLENFVGMNRYRPIYIWASEYSHASMNSISDFLHEGRVQLDWITVQDKRLDSMIDPMQFTVAMFQEVNTGFIERFSVSHECDINLKFLYQLMQKLMQSFADGIEDNSA